VNVDFFVFGQFVHPRRYLVQRNIDRILEDAQFGNLFLGAGIDDDNILVFAGCGLAKISD